MICSDFFIILCGVRLVFFISVLVVDWVYELFELMVVMLFFGLSMLLLLVMMRVVLWFVMISIVLRWCKV